MAQTSPIPSIMDEKKPYFQLDQGQGGIYTLPFYMHKGVEVDCIGTYGCWTCCCVYIRLDKERCFAAHIDGHTRATNKDFDWIPEDEEQKAILRAFVYKMLGEEVPEPFKNKSEVEIEEMRKSLLIVCPRQTTAEPGTGNEVDGTGSVIAETVREYFGISAPAEKEDLAHGFIVNHKTGVLSMLGWDQKVQPTTDMLLEVERAYQAPKFTRTKLQKALIDSSPKMLPPDSAGFFEVPCRQWTLVYDTKMNDFRKMKSDDFNPLR